jgi:hypothetical protein
VFQRHYCYAQQKTKNEQTQLRFRRSAIMRNLIIFGILVPFVGLLIHYFTENTILKYGGFLIILVGLKRLIINEIVKRFGVKYNKV